LCRLTSLIGFWIVPYRIFPTFIDAASASPPSRLDGVSYRPVGPDMAVTKTNITAPAHAEDINQTRPDQAKTEVKMLFDDNNVSFFLGNVSLGTPRGVLFDCFPFVYCLFPRLYSTIALAHPALSALHAPFLFLTFSGKRAAISLCDHDFATIC
jgi:hypothetical protein